MAMQRPCHDVSGALSALSALCARLESSGCPQLGTRARALHQFEAWVGLSTPRRMNLLAEAVRTAGQIDPFLGRAEAPERPVAVREAPEAADDGVVAVGEGLHTGDKRP